MLKLLGKTLQTILILFLSAVLCCNLWLLGAKAMGNDNPKAFGFSWAVVVTGSMEPAISGNDMVIVREQDSYRAGDIIMFQSGDVLVTHRIVEETAAGFVTKGDANNTVDSVPVTEDCIAGKVLWVIPKIGVILRSLKTPLGMTCLVLFGFLLVEGSYILEKRNCKREEGCG